MGLAHYLVMRSDETQRGNGDRPTDLRTSEEPYSLRSEIGKSLALYLLYEVDETQQRFSDLRSFDMQTKQHPKSLALIRVKIQILGTLLKTGRETQRGNGDRPTDLPHFWGRPLKKRKRQILGTLPCNEVDETQQRFSDLRSFDTQRNNTPNPWHTTSPRSDTQRGPAIVRSTAFPAKIIIDCTYFWTWRN